MFVSLTSDTWALGHVKFRRRRSRVAIHSPDGDVQEGDTFKSSSLGRGNSSGQWMQQMTERSKLLFKSGVPNLLSREDKRLNINIFLFDKRCISLGSINIKLAFLDASLHLYKRVCPSVGLERVFVHDGIENSIEDYNSSRVSVVCPQI